MPSTWGDDGWGDQASGDGGSACFKCGEEGHRKSECPQGARNGKSGCFNCGEEGHRKSECPQGAREGKSGCFNCGEEGHMRSECPTGGGDGSKKCYGCGEEGHIRAECPQGGGESGAPVERNYTPEEVGEEELFRDQIGLGKNFENYDKVEVKLYDAGDAEVFADPLESFEDAGFRALVRENIKRSGYNKPTPVQRYSLPLLVEKKDLVAVAQTGSGKTAAFLLPIINMLLEDGVDSGMGQEPQKPQALILAPTRELAVQIKDQARKFSAGSTLKSVVLYGGTSVMHQLSTLSRGCNILISTPGRLNDFVGKGKVRFDELKFLVFDEADRMLEMGFKDTLDEAFRVGQISPKTDRVTMMFSATFANDVMCLAREYLNNFVKLAVGIIGAACSDVRQVVYEVEKRSKLSKLVELLTDLGTDRTMVFVETKKTADFVATFLSEKGMPTTSIHGDRLQRQREEALADFRAGRMPIIVATNVASRGLDIKDVIHVINYDLPKDIGDYVHRIGRTGRVGNEGKSTSFFDPSRSEDTALAPAIVNSLAQSLQEVPEFLKCYGLGGGAAIQDDDEWA